MVLRYAVLVTLSVESKIDKLSIYNSKNCFFAYMIFRKKTLINNTNTSLDLKCISKRNTKCFLHKRLHIFSKILCEYC